MPKPLLLASVKNGEITIGSSFILYIAGLVYHARRSWISLSELRIIKATKNIDVLAMKPGLKRYLILKPLVWPFYFVIEKNPLERLSEVFFKHYGDKGHQYFGTKGLKNFLNDFCKGKNRYEQYVIGFVTSSLVHDESTMAAVIYAYDDDSYLLKIMHGDIKLLQDKEISRYMLDGCERLNASQFRQRIIEAKLEKAAEVLQRVNL